ncbi:MAG: protein-methionine-sulfoxide reductase catalytic subunit MsrP [Chloroflexota bacterium]|nr:protein-methionine-sulfoxide reductase catalytic subunit MsrP [Chloroflexota bacterium]
MGKKKSRSIPIEKDEITPKHIYQSRRQFLKGMGIVGLGAALASCATPQESPASPAATGKAAAPSESATPITVLTDEMDNPVTHYDAVTGYCNYYEFTTSKERVAALAEDFVPEPWSVEVNGLVENPRTFSMQEILNTFDQQERVYRMRCVEAWSMVIPWIGFPLRQLLEEVIPTSEAKYVAFQTALLPDVMDGLASPMFPFPYLEGLRMDEAMHDLTILATGLYEEPLPPQNGAPVRLVVPWKYGFKSIKSIVRISLVAEQPPTMWNAIAPNEYGFYANVNPDVDHPRWSQATERRIGESGRRETLFMNGYAEEVESLYEGMDLTINY